MIEARKRNLFVAREKASDEISKLPARRGSGGLSRLRRRRRTLGGGLYFPIGRETLKKKEMERRESPKRKEKGGRSSIA